MLSFIIVAVTAVALLPTGAALASDRDGSDVRGQRVISERQGLIGAESSITSRLEEVLALVSAHYLHGPPTSDELAAGLRMFVRTLDPYGDYLRPEVFASMESVKSRPYCGVGMDVFWDREERFICIPIPGGSAMEAGVSYGQELLAVEGHDTRLLGIEDIGYLLRGVLGKTATIRVRDSPGGKTREIYLRRKTIRPTSVAMINAGPLPGVRIFKFTGDTPREVYSFLRDVDISRGLIVDIRGNPGGDLQGAVDTAELFLEEGAVICIQQNRAGEKVFRSHRKSLRPRIIYVWQDHITASAAEVFLGAIIDNRKGIGIGEPTFGKGVSQRLFELSRGGALLLSNGTLLTPSWRNYADIGLAPSYRVPPEKRWSDSAYGEMTQSIMRGREESRSDGVPWWRTIIGAD